MRNKKKGIVAVFVVLLAILGVIAFLIFLNINKVKEYKDKLSLGNKYLAELDYENAEITYEAAINIDKKRPQAYVQLSNVYVQQERFDDAWDVLERAESNVKKTEWLDDIRIQQEVVEEAKLQFEELGMTEMPLDDVILEDVEEDTKEEELFSRSSAVAAKNGWTYLNMQTAVYVFKAGSDNVIKQIQGEIEGSLMAIDDGVYYCRDKKLEFYSHVTGEITVIYSPNMFIEPVGITAKYLYFEIDESQEYDSPDVYQMSLSDGTLKKLELDGYCMHSTTAFCGERFFYTVGVADVGTTSLCEVNVETGTSSVIVQNTGNSLVARGDVLYYVETDQAGDYTQVNATVKSWNTVTNEQASYMRGIGGDVGHVCDATESSVYTSRTDTYRIFNDNVKTVKGYYLCREGNKIYTDDYNNGQDRVLCYDEETETVTEIRNLGDTEYPVGVVDGYLYIRSQNTYRREKIS